MLYIEAVSVRHAQHYLLPAWTLYTMATYAGNLGPKNRFGQWNVDKRCRKSVRESSSTCWILFPASSNGRFLEQMSPFYSGMLYQEWHRTKSFLGVTQLLDNMHHTTKLYHHVRVWLAIISHFEIDRSHLCSQPRREAVCGSDRMPTPTCVWDAGDAPAHPNTKHQHQGQYFTWTETDMMIMQHFLAAGEKLNINTDILYTC